MGDASKTHYKFSEVKVWRTLGFNAENILEQFQNFLQDPANENYEFIQSIVQVFVKPQITVVRDELGERQFYAMGMIFYHDPPVV